MLNRASFCYYSMCVINLVAITVMFDRRMYSVDENAGPAQPMIVLSNPSSMNMTVEVRNVNNTAISK